MNATMPDTVPAKLPINEIKQEFLSAIAEHELVVLSAPPGAGKSTGLPLWLVELSTLEKIYLLQPRRMAAKSIASYLAKQLSEPVGQTVGYRLRHETKVSKNTKIEVITEGILTQIMQQDPELAGTSLILFDEFHERSVHADFAFALAREIQTSLRDDLTLVLMSATLSIEFLKSAFPDAHFLASQGRSFPVDITYQPVLASTRQGFSYNAWRDHAFSVLRKTTVNHQGSILVFLPGSGDIKYLAEQLHTLQTHGELSADFHIAPLFGDLSLAEQQQAIAAPTQGYKIVLATNIAETSLTIDGINLVIDCGFEKVAIYDHYTLTNKLVQQQIAKSSATQRAGRAGRLMQGRCIRLYAKEEFERRSADGMSEIMQTDLQPLLIEAARWGVSELTQLPLLEYPNQVLEQQAWETLSALNIVDEKHRLTVHGINVATLSCHPRFAHMLLRAFELEAETNSSLELARLSALGCYISALLEERDLLPREQSRTNIDLAYRVRYLLNKPNQPNHQRIIKQAKQLFNQANGLLSHGVEKRLFPALNEALPLAYCGELLACALPEQIAQKRAQYGEFLASNGKGMIIAQEDALASNDYVVVANASQHKQQLQARIAAPVDLERLKDWQIIDIKNNQVLAYDDKKDVIIAEQQQYFGALVFQRTALHSALSAQQITALWSAQLHKKGLNLLGLSSTVKELLSRWRWVNVHQQKLEFPDVSDAGLLATLSDWFEPYVGDIVKKSQLKQLNYVDMLLSLLDYQQQQLLAKVAPTYFVGPTGRKCPITYSDNLSPTVSMPMQELYGQAQTPSVGELADIPLALSLLSPAGRPIQVTQNLPAFWQGSYKEVQKEMKGRYPKHYWPDDPANAEPTNKTKRHLKL